MGQQYLFSITSSKTQDRPLIKILFNSRPWFKADYCDTGLHAFSPVNKDKHNLCHHKACVVISWCPPAVIGLSFEVFLLHIGEHIITLHVINCYKINNSRQYSDKHSGGHACAINKLVVW